MSINRPVLHISLYLAYVDIRCGDQIDCTLNLTEIGNSVGRIEIKYNGTNHVYIHLSSYSHEISSLEEAEHYKTIMIQNSRKKALSIFCLLPTK